MDDFLTIQYKSDHYTHHHDLLLNIPTIGRTQIADSYYFSSSELTVEEILIQLLTQWKTRIESLQQGEMCFLPFDFSDEYIGCFKLEFCGNETLSGSYGYTRAIMGMEIHPSDIDDFVISDVDYNINSLVFSITKIALIDSIDNSIKLLI